MKSVLIATPAYGGMMTVPYVESLMSTWDWFGQQGIQAATYFISNESLITRARNTCATLCLDNGIDKLLFIDADIGWKSEDVQRLYESEKKIIGGLYPHKTYPIQLNWNPDPATVENDKGEIEVTHIATGFLMIDREVLEVMSGSVPSYESTHMNGKRQRYYDFFGVGAYRGDYESEDWKFCRLAKECGFSCWANLRTVLTHTGTHTWRAE